MHVYLTQFTPKQNKMYLLLNKLKLLLSYVKLNPCL